jgi:hypothetical protein
MKIEALFEKQNFDICKDLSLKDVGISSSLSDNDF